MATTRYTDIALEQAPFANYPGGGITLQGVGPYAKLNDPALELGDVKEVTAIYTMLGNEVANDIVNLYLVQPGEMVDPFGSISGSGIATTATVQVGDDDTTGFGLVSNPNDSGTPPGADPARYANNLNVATGQTNPVQFAGGSALANPYVTGTTSRESSAVGGPIAGAWVQLKFLTLASVVPGKVLVVRLRLVKA